jgi:ATP-dependent RNA helicase DeaD
LGYEEPTPIQREAISDASSRPERDGKPRPKKGLDRKGQRGMVRIHIALGRKSNIRPADLVGAIVNEAGISGREIGKIEMAPGFALVEIPESAVDAVIEALAGAKIRGKRVSARRER